MHVGFLEELAADFASLDEDLFADIESLGVFEVGLVVEPEFLVVITDLGESRGGLKLGFEAEFLIGNVGAGDADFAEVSFDDLCFRGPTMAGPSVRFCSSR